MNNINAKNLIEQAQLDTNRDGRKIDSGQAGDFGNALLARLACYPISAVAALMERYAKKAVDVEPDGVPGLSGQEE